MTYHIHSKEFLVGAVVGSMLGTVTALLLAPKSGKRLRQDICDAYCDISDKTQDLTHHFSKKGKTLMKNMQCQTCNWSDKAKDTVENVSDWMRCSEETPRDLLIGGAIGGVLGAIGGLLLAPKSGSELRQDIVDTYEDVSERTQDLASELTKKGKNVAENVHSQASEWLELAKDIVSQLAGEAQNQTEEIIDKGKRKMQIQSNRINEIMEWASLGYRLWNGVKNRR